MADVLVQDSSLQSIADTIRSKIGGTDTYKPSEMAAAISEIETGGGAYLDNVTVLIADYSDSATYTVTEGAYYGTRRAICTV